MPLDGYLRFRQGFYRAPEALVHECVELHADRDAVWICYRGAEVVRYPRSYEPGTWLAEPRLRPEPPPVAPRPQLVVPKIVPPELRDYAVLCT